MKTIPPHPLQRPFRVSAAVGLVSTIVPLLAGCHGHVRADRPSDAILDGINAEIPAGTQRAEAIGTLERLRVTDITVGPARRGLPPGSVVTGRLPERGFFGVQHATRPKYVELSFDDLGLRRSAHVVSFPDRAEATAK